MFINSPGVSGGLMRAADALGVKPLWAHNSGSIGEPEAAQIGGPSANMLIASDYPSFRDASAYAGHPQVPCGHEGGRQGRRPRQPQGHGHLDLGAMH